MALTHSPADAAARIGTTETFLREKVRAGELPCVRVGRRAIRFTDDQIAEIIGLLSEPAKAKPARSLTTTRSRKKSGTKPAPVKDAA